LLDCAVNKKETGARSAARFYVIVYSAAAALVDEE
jgi:hypothetical protein